MQKLRQITFWLIFLPNLALFYVGLWLTITLWYPHGLSSVQLKNHLFHFSIIYILWMLVFFGFRLFERSSFRRYSSLFFNLVYASIVNLLVAVGYFYFQPKLILTPRRFLLVNALLVFILLLIWNLLIKALVFKRFSQPVYLFSFSEDLHLLEDEIRRQDYLGYRLVGNISEDGLKSLPNSTIVIFPDNLHTDSRLTNTIFELRNRGIEFYNHNIFFEQLLRRVYLPSLNEVWFLQNVGYNRRFFYSLLKTIFDFVTGLILFVIFALTFPIFAALIKLESSGPIFFKQKRVREKGRVFTILKYRTMKQSTDENRWTEKNDPRITAIGKFFRITRIDELPQSINLLLGHMSIVGPRPEQVGIVAELKREIPFYEERHMVKPGITGWAQLNIYAGTLEETKIKLSYDLYYLKHRSLLFDLEILLKTIYYIFTGQGR